MLMVPQEALSLTLCHGVWCGVDCGVLVAVYRMCPDSYNIEVNIGGVVIRNHSQIKALRIHFGSRVFTHIYVG